MVEQDHAIGDVFFQPLARQGAITPFPGNDGRHSLVLEPAKQTAKLRAQNGRVGKTGENRFDGIQNHPFCAYGIDGVAQTDKQASRSYSPVSSISLRSI